MIFYYYKERRLTSITSNVIPQLLLIGITKAYYELCEIFLFDQLKTYYYTQNF
jgi:hypothetical protein